jgi:hypothetical protein
VCRLRGANTPLLSDEGYNRKCVWHCMVEYTYLGCWLHDRTCLACYCVRVSASVNKAVAESWCVVGNIYIGFEVVAFRLLSTFGRRWLQGYNSMKSVRVDFSQTVL